MLCHQAISVGNWDTEYFYTPVDKSAPEGDYIRLLADEPGVQINMIFQDGTSRSINLGDRKSALYYII